jgi:hypothetical protein
MNIHKMSEWRNCARDLRLFLTVDKLPSAEIGTGFVWTKAVFYIWSFARNSNTLDRCFFSLVSNLLKQQVGNFEALHIDQSDFSFLFTVGLRCFRLPVGSSMQQNLMHRGKDGLGSMGVEEFDTFIAVV